jgi:hypothetical protein
MKHLAQDQPALMRKIKIICGDTWPNPETEDEQTITWEMRWTNVWDQCKEVTAVDYHIDAEIRKDPDKIVEMPDADRGKMWQVFNQSKRGREILLTEMTRPHRLFIEIFRRDMKLHNVMQPYVLQKIYLECDNIEIEKRLGPSLEDALRWKSHLHLATINPNDLQSVDNRIQALWLTVDLTGHGTYDWEGGAVQVIHKIKERREEVEDPYAFTIRADAVVRKQIYTKMYLDPEKFPDIPTSLRWLLADEGRHLEKILERVEHQCIRSAAKNLLEILSQDLAAAARPTYDATTPQKIPPTATTEPADTAEPDARKAARNKMRKEQKKRDALLLKEYKHSKGKGKGDTGKNDTPKGRGKKGGKDKPRIPPAEWKKITTIDSTNPKDRKRPKCRWWNSSIGCDRADKDCQYTHGMCLLCNQNHKYCDRHL